MTTPSAAHHHSRLRIDGAGLRQRLAEVAAAIATSEEQVAETLERLALVMPANAARLRARAAQARQNARQERSRAAKFGLTHEQQMSRFPVLRRTEHGPRPAGCAASRLRG
jgi:hypothetical protein